MVGSNMRKDEGSFNISNNNVFSALESLRKKKKSDKEKKSKGSSKAPAKEPQVFWSPAPLNSKSWADVDDEDDDDYYATTAPPPALWSSQDAQGSKEVADAVEESESEDDMLDLGDEDVEDDHEQEQEEVVIHPEPVANKAPETSLPVKETERQLSKKERKKKELEELDALLADFGVTQKESDVQSDAQAKEVAEPKKEEANGNGDKMTAPSESKNAKKKKKKDKSAKEAKEAKETQEQPDSSDVNGELNEEDMKERLKKIAAMKKKKSGKDLDGAAKAAAQEAAARNARLAAGKKKEKNHYNQQPVR